MPPRPSATERPVGLHARVASKRSMASSHPRLGGVLPPAEGGSGLPFRRHASGGDLIGQVSVAGRLPA